MIVYMTIGPLVIIFEGLRGACYHFNFFTCAQNFFFDGLFSNRGEYWIVE